jgi:hypothetical protein
MPLTLVVTPGATNANTYATEAEALAYYEGRLPSEAWESADSQAALLVMATRTIDGYFLGRRTRLFGAVPPAYIVGPQWTGDPASSTQKLAWPRSGMYNGNGVAIAETVIPSELKDATIELAIQLAANDGTADLSAAVQGITSIKAGSVSVGFAGPNAQTVTSKPLPDAVLLLIPPSWYTDEYIDGGELMFETAPV